MASNRNLHGFTVIELLVVLAALALLLSISAPRYVQHLDLAREVALKQNLRQMRDSIDKFYTDHGRYPATLAELADRRYLRAIPEDPITQRTDTWRVTAPRSGTAEGSGVYEVHSGAREQAKDGSTYADW